MHAPVKPPPARAATFLIRGLAAALMSGAAMAQQAEGDPVAGLRLAREVCAACHRIDGATGAGPRPGAPDFATAARIPSLAGMGLRVFLMTPHGDMPRYQFEAKEISDIIAYLRSLAKT